jgi:hypothetical protein
MVFRFFKYIFLLPAVIFALEIQRDAQDIFIFTDGVLNLSSQTCQNDVFFMPENASFYGDSAAPGVPFRIYTIALPNSMPPNVQVENLKSEVLKGKPCGAEQNPKALKVGEPYLRDNLWRVKVVVPLLYSTGNSWNLRKNFRLRVNFNGNASGYSVGKRALSSVENKNGAARFGIKTQAASLGKALKSSTEGIDWLLRIGIGTKDLSAPADGMYAVSFDDLRKIVNSNIDGIPVGQLRLFSASPDTLPEIVGKETFPSSVEIPILVKDKNENGIFDNGDSLVFFGYGTAIWKKSNSGSGMDYYFSHSPYSYYQYFYLGAGGEGKRLNRAQKGASDVDISWKKYVRSEKELILRDNYYGDNSIEENTGKEWFWAWGVKNGSVTVEPSEFQNSVRSLNGLQGNSVLIGVSFFPRRSTTNSTGISAMDWKDRMKDINFRFYFQNQQLPNTAVKDTIFGGTFVFESANANSANNLYKLEILSTSQNDRFDGLSVAYNYDVTKSAGNEWLFPGQASGQLRIPVPANMELIKTVDFIPTEILDGASDIILSGEDTKYFLHIKNTYKTPAFIEGIPNRMNSVSEPLSIPADTEYLILTSEVLQAGAVNLKQFRESGEASTRFKTAVVLVEDIYREHGAQKNSPVAIRDYIAYAKNRCPNLKYVLLAGNGNYDYRNIRSNSKNSLIPPYEAEDYSSDDFFAVLEPNKKIRFGDYDYSDLAIGRLPVSNAAEFENYIQKAKNYEGISAMDNGIWRNTIIFNADDAMQGSNIDGIPHTQQMETTATLVDTLAQRHGFAMDLRKISLLQYEKDGSNKKPEAAKELLLRLNQGALFTIFYGHGNTVQWADEDLLNTSSLSSISNLKRYTILGSFSCMVARFDDAANASLSEVFVTAKDKGAIASIGALRTSNAPQNVRLAGEILRNSLFTPNNLLGDAMLNAKRKDILNAYYRYNNEKYVLLGEPVLSMPRQGISLSLNNVPDTIQALQNLNISGNASVQTGMVRMQVLEGDRFRTLTQKNCDSPLCSETIRIPGIPIYSEELQIKNGKFSTEFITPRKLSLGDTSAQIRLWSYKPGSAEIGRTVADGIALYGTSPYAYLIEDNTPPSIKIYPCMRSGIAAPFGENAQVSLEIPACLDVVIEDDTGIDYREEADEGVTFEVSPLLTPWHPWSFSEQTGKRATARMNFGSSYNPGDYVFKVQAQDVLGNAVSRSLRISLTQENKEGLADIFNMPNPMKKSGTTFYFKDLSGERQSSVTIKIFDQNGKLVKTINNAISGQTHWDGRDSRGRLLANGLYHYVVLNTVQPLSETGSKKTFEKKQKLVISR